MNRKVKLLGIAIILILIAICSVIVNTYLSKRHLFVYATGTNDKAFLNATWKMSPQEIERANKASLSASSASQLLFLFTPEVTDQSRFKAFAQKDVFLWGHTSQVHYEFFDNMLYEYYISLTAYDLEKPHKEILETLGAQFGKGKEAERKRPDIIYSFEWDTEKQTISYWMGNNEDKKTYYVGIKALYKPFYREIENIAKNEKKAYF